MKLYIYSNKPFDFFIWVNNQLIKTIFLLSMRNASGKYGEYDPLMAQTRG